MDELLDILDSNGKHTGKKELKSYVHRMGLFHDTIHVWFYTGDGQLLIQKRGKDKKTFPLLWDVSVAGHVAAGEQIEISAIREVKEEIGVQISEEQLQKIGVFKSVQKHGNDLVDSEFHHTYLSELTLALHELKPQKDEVADLRIISIELFSKEIEDDNARQKYVPHTLSYYKTILKEVEKRL